MALAAGTGEVVVDPGADRPGIDLAPELVGFLRRMAEFLPRPPIVTTGSNHSPYTTSGNVSDHWDGHAADLGSMRNGFPATGGGYGDTIAEAAFLAAGEPPAAAKVEAAKGGLYTIDRDGLRIQIIWKTYEGGDHYNHVHVGVRRAAAWRDYQRLYSPLYSALYSGLERWRARTLDRALSIRLVAYLPSAKAP